VHGFKRFSNFYTFKSTFSHPIKVHPVMVITRYGYVIITCHYDVMPSGPEWSLRDRNQGVVLAVMVILTVMEALE
jgi:hypothetical protein